MSNNIKDAITYALLITLVVAVIMLQGCSTLHLINDTVEQSRQYCDSISETKQQYQQCMDRETRFLNYETERR